MTTENNIETLEYMKVRGALEDRRLEKQADDIYLKKMEDALGVAKTSFVKAIAGASNSLMMVPAAQNGIKPLTGLLQLGSAFAASGSAFASLIKLSAGAGLAEANPADATTQTAGMHVEKPRQPAPV